MSTKPEYGAPYSIDVPVVSIGTTDAPKIARAVARSAGHKVVGSDYSLRQVDPAVDRRERQTWIVTLTVRSEIKTLTEVR